MPAAREGGAAWRPAARRSYWWITTGVPGPTRRTSASTSGFDALMHPCESAPPSGPVVPWIAIRLPPSQPDGRWDWVALVASAQHP
jgi:hypothetical protein